MHSRAVVGLCVAVAGLTAACEMLALPPDMDEVRALETKLEAIPYAAGDGTITEDRLRVFLAVREKAHAVEVRGKADIDELRRANAANAATMSQINRLRRHTDRVLAARAQALTAAGMGFPEYRHIHKALAELPWDPEVWRGDEGLSASQIANARLFQAHVGEIRRLVDLNQLRKRPTSGS